MTGSECGKQSITSPHGVRDNGLVPLRCLSHHAAECVVMHHHIAAQRPHLAAAPLTNTLAPTTTIAAPTKITAGELARYIEYLQQSSVLLCSPSHVSLSAAAPTTTSSLAQCSATAGSGMQCKVAEVQPPVLLGGARDVQEPAVMLPNSLGMATSVVTTCSIARTHLQQDVAPSAPPLQIAQHLRWLLGAQT